MIDEVGNVGIGTPIPSEKLDVRGGDARFGEDLHYIRLGYNGAHAFIDSKSETDIEKGKLHINWYSGCDVVVGGGGSVWGQPSTGSFSTRWNTRLATQGGSVGIGPNSGSNSYMLDVRGGIHSCRSVVKTTGWCDYVFDEDYKLSSLHEIEQYINENGHLPEVPTEAEVLEEGIDLGEMNKLLLKKVEELTLYVIDLQKQINELTPKKQ